jgi:hypothetical protein
MRRLTVDDQIDRAGRAARPHRRRMACSMDHVAVKLKLPREAGVRALLAIYEQHARTPARKLLVGMMCQTRLPSRTEEGTCPEQSGTRGRSQGCAPGHVGPYLLSAPSNPDERSHVGKCGQNGEKYARSDSRSVTLTQRKPRKCVAFPQWVILGSNSPSDLSSGDMRLVSCSQVLSDSLTEAPRGVPRLTGGRRSPPGFKELARREHRRARVRELGEVGVARDDVLRVGLLSERHEVVVAWVGSQTELP